MAGNRIKGITIEINGETKGLSKSLEGVNKQIKETSSKLKDVEKLLKMDPGNTELLRQKQAYLKDAISETKEKLEQEKEALKQLQSAGNSQETIEAQRALKREIEATEQQLKTLKDESKEFGSVFKQQSELASQKIGEVGQKIKDVGSSVTEFGGKITAGVTVPMVAGATAAVKMASDFEDAIAKVSTIADTTEVPIEELRDSIVELSNETGISSSEIAENVYNAISAGQKTGDAVNFVDKATRLARAGFAETGDALDILTTIMNSYGLEADQVAKVSDTLIMTQNLGKTTVAELSSAMGKAIPTAKSVGVNLDQLSASYAVMTSNGIATAETTTYLNSMMNELGKDGTKAAKAFAEGTEHIKKGGLTMKEAMDMGWQLSDVLSILDEQASVSGTSINNLFGSAEAGKAASVLWDNAQQLNEAIAQMSNGAGATDEAFSKLETNSFTVQKTLNELKNAGVELGTTIMSMLAPYIEKLAEKIHQLSSWFMGLSDEQKKWIVIIGAIIAAIGPVIAIIGGIISAVGVLTTVISFLVSPIGLIILAITAVIAIGVLLWKNWDTIKEKALELGANLSAKFQEIKDSIVAKITELKDRVIGKFIELKTNAINKVLEMKSNFISKIIEMKDSVIQKFVDIKTGIEEKIHEMVEGALSWGRDIIQGLVDGIKQKIEDVKNAAAEVASAIWEKLHFSEPENGPLADFHTYMPDMIAMMVKGLNEGVSDLSAPMSRIAAALIPDPNAITNGSREQGNAMLSEMQRMMQIYFPMLSGDQNTNVTVVLDGDAKKMFNVVKQEASSFRRSTGLNAFA